MKKTLVKTIESDITISYNDSICFIGSCFSDEMSVKCKGSGFSVLSNPFGVVFNPVSIAELITRSLDKVAFDDTILKQNDVYLSWLANRTVFSYDEESMRLQLKHNAATFRTSLCNSKTLFITLGTAWGYKLKESNQVVANCHKHPQELFQKVLLTSTDILASYRNLLSKIKDAFPHLKIIFTISPVRHIKDGLIENNISKSHLITAVHQLVSEFDFVNYFPSYEIVLDELRDYAYYKGDGIHPNEFAVNRIWDTFKSSYLDDKTKVILNEFERLSIQSNHKQLHDASEEATAFNEKLKQRIIDFKLKYPNVVLTKAMEELCN